MSSFDPSEVVMEERIIQLHAGPTSWAVYDVGEQDVFKRPRKSTVIALVELTFIDEHTENVVTPLICTLDGGLDMADRFPGFIGMIHQETEPSDSDVEKFKQMILTATQEIVERFDKKLAEAKKAADKKPEDPDAPKDPDDGKITRFKPRKK